MVHYIQRDAILAGHGDGFFGVIIQPVRDNGKPGHIQCRTSMGGRRNGDATGKLFCEAWIDFADDYGNSGRCGRKQPHLAACLFAPAKYDDRRIIHVEEGRELAHARPLLFSIADRSVAKMALDG